MCFNLCVQKLILMLLKIIHYCLKTCSRSQQHSVSVCKDAAQGTLRSLCVEWARLLDVRCACEMIKCAYVCLVWLLQSLFSGLQWILRAECVSLHQDYSKLRRLSLSNWEGREIRSDRYILSSRPLSVCVCVWSHLAELLLGRKCVHMLQEGFVWPHTRTPL